MGTLCSAVLLTGCGRLGDMEDREPFGSDGSDQDTNDQGGDASSEEPGSGGTTSESCYDGVLQPGELCQVQVPDDLDAGVDPCSLTIADFDADGRPDLAVPNSNFWLYPGGTHVANVLRGYGNGNFAPTQPYDAGAELPVGLAAGDFDGDGLTDIATANNDAQAAFVLRNIGGANMGFAAPDDVPVSSVASSIAAGDFNEDGIDDLLVNTSDGIALLRGGPGGASLFDTLELGGGRSMHAELVDLDADGHLDLVAAVSDTINSNHRLMIFHGAGDGSFVEFVEHALGGEPWWVVSGDLNLDGDLDLAVAEYGTNQVSMLLGNSLGGFSPRTTIDVCDGPQSVAIGDMNNDGANDIVVGCMESDTVQVWVQGAGGVFELTRWWTTGLRPVSVQLGDLNLDGQLDIAWANQYGNTVGLVISHL
ncbi:putative aggregation factor core protein MAFp3, isoform C [Enhygromyxa salina]|uniref:Putative aggregation factor core protein MAFp3, isoform C n=1 Tax=Enhygromyxa salina TaxID=215803 RepID=A0A0C1ZLT1_9BACT|nr:VCBS repeat-containing protein [Enhygromyxa salina]KIG11728.1 putative aggregation factor core protein MAFp3, isoform C [Enhygromyxa salina]